MPKRPRMPFPRPLSGLVQENLVGFGLAERLREAEIWRIWPDVVGAALATRARPVRIINGTLTVAVSSAPWMQELRFMTAMMKEKLNTRLGFQTDHTYDAAVPGFAANLSPETGRVRGVSPHRLRDAFAVMAVKQNDSGDGIRLLQEHLGHQSITTTMRYRKVSGEEQKEWYDKLWQGGKHDG